MDELLWLLFAAATLSAATASLSLGAWLDLESYAKLQNPPVYPILASVTMIF